MINYRTSRIDTLYLWDDDTRNKHKVAQQIERNMKVTFDPHPDEVPEEGNNNLIQHGHKEY